MSATEEAARTIEAIYEHGTFRVLDADTVKIPEGQRVRLIIASMDGSQDSLELLRNVYAGLSESEIDKIEGIMLDRSNWDRNISIE